MCRPAGDPRGAYSNGTFRCNTSQLSGAKRNLTKALEDGNERRIDKWTAEVERYEALVREEREQANRPVDPQTLAERVALLDEVAPGWAAEDKDGVEPSPEIVAARSAYLDMVAPGWDEEDEEDSEDEDDADGETLAARFAYLDEVLPGWRGDDPDNWDADGIHRDTGTRLNSAGFDSAGNHAVTGTAFGPDGFNWGGYDEEGYGRDGYDRSGYDRNWCDRNGVHVTERRAS